jgi:hypothetical protein
MVTVSNSFRNLTQRPENVSPQLAAQVDQCHQAPRSGPAATPAVDALSDLLSGAASFDSPAIEAAGGTRDRYDTYGYPDLLAQLWALVIRPVGKGVHTTTRTVTVDTPNGPVQTEVSESEYYNRQLTPEEHLYLDQQERLKRRRVHPGDAQYLTHPELR